MANVKYLYVDPTSGFTTEDLLTIDTFEGPSGASRAVKTNSSGKIDNSLINFSAFDRVFDVRAASNIDLTLSAPGATIGGVTMVSGDRFLAYGQTTTADNGIYIWNGAAAAATRWADYDSADEISAGDLVVVTEGTFAERVYILATNSPITVGTTALTYSPLGTQLIDAGTGLSYNGTTLNVNLAAGGGLKFVSDEIAVEPADFAGTGLQDDGADNLEIDFADPATEMNTSRAVKASDLSNNGPNQGAKILGFDPANVSGLTAATTLQGAVEDALEAAAAPGVDFTVGAGGVTKGFPVYISGDDTVRAYTGVSSGTRVVGLAYSTTAAAGNVRVVKNSTVLTGVLSGATAGTRYYWNGSGLTTTIPTGANAYVWVVGEAKNATDLFVDVQFLKRNSP